MKDGHLILDPYDAFLETAKNWAAARAEEQAALEAAELEVATREWHEVLAPSSRACHVVPRLDAGTLAVRQCETHHVHERVADAILPCDSSGSHAREADVEARLGRHC